MNKDILRIAIPSIVTNITVPLLGMVDLSIAGHIGSAAVIGAISVGGLIFNMVYWLFNFLRMGSSGLTAQAYGRRNGADELRVLRMALTVALVSGFGIFAIQRPIEWIAHLVVSPTDEVWQLAVAYFRIRVWAAPAVLSLFALNGWMVGMQNSRYPMYIAVGQNLLNIVASAFFVFNLRMGIEGVALGTVVSQYVGMIVALYFVWRTPRHAASTEDAQDEAESVITWFGFFTVNKDIFLRMICLIAVTTAFTSFGARQGELLLAVNSLLIQLFILFSYFCDGFALAGEALIGKYVGAQQHDQLRICVSRLFLWSGGVTVLFSFLYAFASPLFLSVLTDDVDVVQGASPYIPWIVLVPVCGFAAFMWDGIFVGATATRQMLITLFLASVCFFVVFSLPLPMPENHHLWLAFILYLLTRSLIQTWMARRVL